MTGGLSLRDAESHALRCAREFGDRDLRRYDMCRLYLSENVSAHKQELLLTFIRGSNGGVRPLIRQPLPPAAFLPAPLHTSL